MDIKQRLNQEDSLFPSFVYSTEKKQKQQISENRKMFKYSNYVHKKVTMEEH